MGKKLIIIYNKRHLCNLYLLLITSKFDFILLLWYIPYWINGQFIPTKVKKALFEDDSYLFDSKQHRQPYLQNQVPLNLRIQVFRWLSGGYVQHQGMASRIFSILRDMPFPNFENILAFNSNKAWSFHDSELSNMKTMYSFGIETLTLKSFRMLLRILGRRISLWINCQRAHGSIILDV